MDEKVIWDLDQTIGKLFSKKELAVYNEHLEIVKCNGRQLDLFLSIPKVSMLIFGRPDVDDLTPRGKETRNYRDFNAPIVDGLFPLHLAVMTSSPRFVRLLRSYGAKLDVKCCGDPDSPFYALTPLELGLCLLSNLIPWTPQMSVHQLLCMFHDNVKAKSLMLNITYLLRDTPSIRHLVANYSLQGKVVEVAALLKVASLIRINVSTMYIPTPSVPPQLHFGLPMTLRLLVASRYAALIKEAIQISGSLNPDDCTRQIKEMDSIRTLLESADRGDLNGFDAKRQLTVELTHGSSKALQDELKVNTVAPRYLNSSLYYIEPSKRQPPGVFNSLMPLGYTDSLKYYDGLDMRNCNALAEAIFRVLDGRKVDELSLQDTSRFRFKLEYYLKKKCIEAETLTALETNQVMEKKGSTPRMSLPGVSYPVSKGFEHLGVNKIPSSVFSAIKRGKA